MQYSTRLQKLPPYLFAKIDALKAEKLKEGVDVIDLGVGDPDLPTPPHIVEALCTAARNPATHHYPSYEGMPEFREAVARWFRKRFGVAPDPETEVLALIGSKEGIAHIPEAFVNPGDYVIGTDPGYPVYRTSTIFAGGRYYPLPITPENGFLPDLDTIPREVCERARIFFCGYPNNPTAATATVDWFAGLVDFARENDIVVVHDNAYSEITFDGYRAPSFLETPGASEVGIEMHSLSKTYNMTGWRIGFAVGNAEIIAGLGKVKTNIDSGAFEAIQHAAIAALTGPQDCVGNACRIYRERRDVLVKGLEEAGFDVTPPKATFYVWLPVGDSMEFAASLLNDAGIVVTPGTGFGPSGEGFVRFALTRPVERIREAVERIIGVQS
ncbi:MAG: LL-diaminopimelate aminotransferase [Methanoculleaceae archaeon]